MELEYTIFTFQKQKEKQGNDRCDEIGYGDTQKRIGKKGVTFIDRCKQGLYLEIEIEVDTVDHVDRSIEIACKFCHVRFLHDSLEEL